MQVKKKYNTTEDVICRLEMPEDNHADRKRSMPQDAAVQSKKGKVNINQSQILREYKSMEVANKQ